MVGGEAFGVYETAAALERAEASARVLAARARARGARPSGGPGVFAALAACAPEGLVPPRGTGAAHLLRYLDSAASAAARAGSALPADVVEALAWVVADAARQTAASSAMDPQEVSRAARRQVAAVRGLMAHTMPRDRAWELARLGTFLPRAGWVAALLGAAARLSSHPDWGAGEPWAAAAGILGVEPDAGAATPRRLLLDECLPFSLAFALAEVEAALFALERNRQGGRALPMARAAHSRLRRPEAVETIAAGRADGVVDEVLDALGAVAALAVPAPEGEPTRLPVRGPSAAAPLSGAA
jgi:uncharacterized alpha-E superfamily protein